MYLPVSEKERRRSALRERMRKEGLDAILVIGDSAKSGIRGTGSFRYLTDFFIYFNYSLLLSFIEADPVMLVPTENSRYWASKRSWINEVRLSRHYPSDIVNILKEKATHGRLGLTVMEAFPPSLYQYLQENIPTWELIDASPILFDLRFSKSHEEQKLLKEAAEIVDAGFQAVLKMIRPGTREYEIVGFLEGFHRGHGSDQTFNLISSGSFPGNGDERFPTLPTYPSGREIMKGDVICLEMTAVSGGYWNQLVREVSVGKENHDLSSFHRAVVKTTQEGVVSMKPDVLTSDFIDSMERAAKREGFRLTEPLGHYAGLDLVEAPISPGSKLPLRPGTAAIVHPCLSDAKGTRMFWGQTFLVGDHGSTSVNSTDDELVVV